MNAIFYVLFVLFTILNQRPLKYSEYRYFNFHIKLLQGITHIIIWTILEDFFFFLQNQNNNLNHACSNKKTYKHIPGV